MGILDDKRYEELDWVSKAIEPLEHKLSGILVTLPNEVDIDYNMLTAVLGESYYLQMDVSSILRYLQKQYKTGRTSYEEDKKLDACFKLEVEPGTSVDFDNKVLVGSIRLTKTKFSFEDSDLKNLMGMSGLQYYTSNINRHNTNVARITEVMDVLGVNKDEEDFYKTRSGNRKTIMLANRLNRLMRENEWNIRNMDIADKVPQWIVDYVNDGNLAAWANLCKLKVMTHKGLPIYSVDEV